MREFSFTSVLGAPPEVVWEHAVSPAGVNRELAPVLRMSFPTPLADVTSCWQPGRRQFRSWILIGGLLPVDYDDVTFDQLEPGRRFLERSSLLSQRVWQHERTIDALPGGCRLTDRIAFEPRLRWLSPAYIRVFTAVFRLRHRNLRRIFGEAAG